MEIVTPQLDEQMESVPETNDIVETTTSDTTQETQSEIHQLPSDEEIARKSGWVPKEEFKGDPNLWKSAKQFNDYGQLLDITHQQKRKIQRLTEQQEELRLHMQAVKEAAYNEALATLKAKRKEAIEIGDVETAERLIEAQANLKAPEPIQSEPNELVQQALRFKEENKWLKTDNDTVATDIERRMSAYAIEREKQLLTQGIEYDTILRTVKEEVQKGFPDYFNTPVINPASTKPPAVSPRSVVSQPSNKLTLSDLPAEERAYINALKSKLKNFDLEEYLVNTRGSANK